MIYAIFVSEQSLRQHSSLRSRCQDSYTRQTRTTAEHPDRPYSRDPRSLRSQEDSLFRISSLLLKDSRLRGHLPNTPMSRLSGQQVHFYDSSRTCQTSPNCTAILVNYFDGFYEPSNLARRRWQQV